MSLISSDILNIFVKAPGDFLYFLVVIIFSLFGLVMALNLQSLVHLRPAASRYSAAFALVIASWGLFFLGTLYSALTSQPPLLILPPLERLVNVLVVVALGWAMATADHTQWRRLGNIAALALAGLALVAYLLTALDWSTVYEAGLSDFNVRYNVSWSLALMVVCGFGIGALVALFRHVLDAPLKIVFFVLILLAGLYQATAGILVGSYPGAVRLAMVMSLLIPLFILYRLQYQQLLTIAERARDLQVRAEAAALRTASPARPAVVDNQSALLMRTLGQILDKATASTLPEQIVRTTLDTMRVDIGFLVRVQDANYADVVYAYDKVMQRSPSSISLNLNNQPTLLNAIERKMPRTLYVDRNRDELEDLFTRLDIDRIGTVYLFPLVRNDELKAILGVGLPYTERELDYHSEELLKSISILASSLISLSDEAAEARILAEDRAIQAMVEGVALANVPDDAAIHARQEIQNNLQLARDQITQLSKQVVQLKLQLDDERSRLASLLDDSQQDLSISQTLVAIHDEQQRLREERDRLAMRLQEAEAALTGATSSSNLAVVDQMVEALEREKQKLTRERDRLQAQLNEMQVQGNLMLPEYMQKIIGRMQEEQSRLEQERTQLADKLALVQNQLQGLGIENDVTGLAPLITQLYDERATMAATLEALMRDKELLLLERARLGDSISGAKETDQRIQQLQAQVEHLAQDREVALKQRDRARAEFLELQRKLDNVKEHRARLLAQVSGYEIELNEARDEQVKLRLEIQALADARSELMHQRDRLLAEKQVLETQLQESAALSTGDTARLEAISAENTARLQKMVNELSEARNRLEHELNEARSQLAQAGRDRERMEKDGGSAQVVPYTANNPELFVGLVQELRTPLTSLIGYVDLLLGESAGILGEMQRKFLQRVSANISRLETMIEDLVHVAQLDQGNYKLEPMPISIVAIIEDAITNAAIQFREKVLTVNLDLEDDLPLLPADKDSVSQIIGQLLTNAYLVSPPQSELHIHARRQLVQIPPGETPVDVIMVSVEDRGGGIQPEDVPRVFARKYKAENPLIQGLGDTGVGMSIAKTLAEAHGGRLWVETRPNVGSTFSFVLPVERAVETDAENAS
mgnify:CR=1 FL=1